MQYDFAAGINDNHERIARLWLSSSDAWYMRVPAEFIWYVKGKGKDFPILDTKCWARRQSA